MTDKFMEELEKLKNEVEQAAFHHAEAAGRLGNIGKSIEQLGVEANSRRWVDVASDHDLPPNKEWRGPDDGLPPVGIECEVNVSFLKEFENFKQGVVQAHVVSEGRDIAVIQLDNDFTSREARYFRPIKTEEEKAVEEMLRHAPAVLTGSHWEWDHPCKQDCVDHKELMKWFCEALHREGYKKGK